MATFGTFTLIKNEEPWIRAHLLSWLPFIDQAVLFDGNSTDGTLEIIKDIAKSHPFGHRITLVEDRDPKNLEDDYVRMFNECLHTLKTDYACFAHPDMILDDAGDMAFLGDALAYTVNMRSFAGEPDGQMYEIKTGRAPTWKNIFRLRNPDLGLHYWGAYGSVQEDCYFSKISGNEHKYYKDPERYPYKIGDSGIKISHFSDVRPIERRIDRMVKCLINQGSSVQEAVSIARVHPRVNFENSFGFTFEPVPTPEYLKEGIAA